MSNNEDTKLVTQLSICYSTQHFIISLFGILGTNTEIKFLLCTSYTTSQKKQQWYKTCYKMFV